MTQLKGMYYFIPFVTMYYSEPELLQKRPRVWSGAKMLKQKKVVKEGEEVM